MPDYALEGPRWNGATITWSVDGTVASDLVPMIAAAFSDWAGLANLHFQQLATSATADIQIAERAIDGPNGTLGVTNYAYSGASFISAHIAFDSDEGWHATGAGTSAVVSAHGASLRVTAEHEIGHALGLDHYSGAPAVMNPMLSASVTGPTASDVHAIQALYGAPASQASDAKVAAAAPAASPAVVPAPSPSPGAAPSTSGHAGFDAAYYLAHNPDVAAAAAGAGAGAAAFAWTHYAAFGWHEGRDPNALFDTSYYLVANPDVAAARVNPLDHYEAFGWREGRDPNALLDASYYLARNPDVAAAGIDPMTHYDVYGWREGRDPSAKFGTAAYERANPDVAATGMDPLAHYLAFGIQEGRHLA